MKATVAIQQLYQMQAVGMVSAEAVGFFLWFRWQAHPFVVFQANASRLAALHSPATTKADVQRWLNELTKLKYIKRVSKQGRRVPTWKIMLDNKKPEDETQNPQKEKTTPKVNLPF